MPHQPARLRSIRNRFLCASIALAIMSSTAQAALISKTISFVNTTDTEQLIGFKFTSFAPGTPTTGVVTTRLDAAFAFADGARDGVSVKLGNEPTGLATGKLGSAADLDNLAAVLGSGSAQDFAGAGGLGASCSSRVTQWIRRAPHQSTTATRTLRVWASFPAEAIAC